MIVTKEQQEKLLDAYIKKGGNKDKWNGFADGINATLNLCCFLGDSKGLYDDKEQSECCGADIIHSDICKECGEHCK